MKYSRKGSLRSPPLVRAKKKNCLAAPAGADGRARTPAKSIFNIIFEFSAVFTCYLTYYKPIAKKVDLAHPGALSACGACAESIFNIIFEFSAVFACYLIYYKPIAKKGCSARPGAPWACGARKVGFFYIYEFILSIYLIYFNGPRLKTVVLRWLM